MTLCTIIITSIIIILLSMYLLHIGSYQVWLNPYFYFLPVSSLYCNAMFSFYKRSWTLYSELPLQILRRKSKYPLPHVKFFIHEHPCICGVIKRNYPQIRSSLQSRVLRTLSCTENRKPGTKIRSCNKRRNWEMYVCSLNCSPRKWWMYRTCSPVIR